MRKLFDTVNDPTTGLAVANATVQVNAYPGGGAAALYSDPSGLTRIPNPVLTDANGYFEFYAADGRYSLIITTTSATKTLNDVTLGVLPTKDDNTASGSKVLMGANAPAGANGNNGDIYLRTDTGGSTLYRKENGAWVAKA